MTRWVIYRVEAYQPASQWKLLGEVEAPHQPAAILQAFKNWPDQLDPKQVQAGLIARQKRNAGE